MRFKDIAMFKTLARLFKRKRPIYFELEPCGDQSIVVTNFNPEKATYQTTNEALALETLLSFRSDPTGRIKAIIYRR